MDSFDKDLSLYEWDFISSPPDEYFCGLCREVFTMPMIIECCGGHFCATCIKKSNGNLYSCPDCQEENTVAIFDKKMWKKILDLNVHCPFNYNGCRWIGSLSARTAHLTKSCLHIDLRCKYGCGEKLEASELARHLDYFCPNRPIICPLCNERGTHDFINTKHKDECLELKIQCPNKCESVDMKRRDLKQHLLECPLEIVECDYCYAGCSTTVRRKNLNKHHQENFQSHIAFITNFFEAELQKLELHLSKVSEEIEERLRQQSENHSQEIKAKNEMIAKLTSEREKEIERRLHEAEQSINRQLDKIAGEFEQKYEELRLNIHRLNQVPMEGSLEIDRKQLEMTSLLHRGKHTAEIWFGQYKGKKIVIKRPISGTSPSEILKEAHILKQLKHSNILLLYDAITTGEPVCMILEYMVNGNLEEYLKNNSLLLHQQIYVCKQVACGLEYLQEKLCIHRRIRVDNVLVGEKLTCKINDLSSAIILQNHDEEYSAAKGFKIRVKWSPPEVLQKKRFSLKSDVWPYGILMWQVVMSGQEPYPGLTVDQAEQHICTGTHMPRPSECSENFYTLMLDCWKLDPQARPTFEALVDLLDHVKDSHKYIDRLKILTSSSFVHNIM